MPYAFNVRLLVAMATACGCAADAGAVEPGSTGVTSGGGGTDQNVTHPVEQGGSAVSIGGGAGTTAVTPPHPGDASTGSAGSFDPPSSEPPLAPLTFTASTEDFLNPERGFHADLPLPAETIDDTRRQGLSLLRSYVVLDRTSDTISASLLSNLTASLRAVRDRGLKLVLRFSYGTSAGPDAPQSRILAHIAQLKPTLQANSDILWVLQAGFIGQWGEWHDSTNGLDNDASRKTILFVAARCGAHIPHGTGALSLAAAFDLSGCIERLHGIPRVVQRARRHSQRSVSWPTTPTPAPIGILAATRPRRWRRTAASPPSRRVTSRRVARPARTTGRARARSPPSSSRSITSATSTTTSTPTSTPGGAPRVACPRSGSASAIASSSCALR